MVQRVEIIGVHTELDEDVRRYASSKLATLDRYIPVHGRGSAHLEVRLQEEKLDGQNQAICEALLHLPRRTISLKERGATLYEVTNVLRTHLKQQIQKYKDEFVSGKHRRQSFARFRRRYPTQASITDY